MGAFLRTRACAHIYMAYISYKNYILLYSHGLPVHKTKKDAPKRKPSLFFCCTRFVFFAPEIPEAKSL